MIQPNELMIGNILTSKSWRGYHPIQGIERTKEGFKVKVKGFLHEYKEGNYFDLDAITLTEEILLKVGFEKDSDGWMHINFNNDSYGIIFNGEFWEFYLFDLTKLNYLHQLQNLIYILTGKELNIDKLL